jgi:RNA polymerase sigma-70 factor (ECF subfamily)
MLNMGAISPGAEAETRPAFAEGLTDAEVMLRVKAGEAAAFDYLVAKYRRAMVSFMYRACRNQGAAEDLAQEVFLRVYRSRAGYEASAKFTTWLYRIATNLAVNHARDTRHERPENQVSIDQPDEETGTTLDVADDSLTAEESLLRRERMEAIRQKVRQPGGAPRKHAALAGVPGIPFARLASGVARGPRERQDVVLRVDDEDEVVTPRGHVELLELDTHLAEERFRGVESALEDRPLARAADSRRAN